MLAVKADKNKTFSSVSNTKTKCYLYFTITKTAAREDFGNLKFGPRAPNAYDPCPTVITHLTDLFFIDNKFCFIYNLISLT